MVDTTQIGDESWLRQLIAAGESDRVEFTESLTKTDKFEQATCAFSNDMSGHGKPGYLLIGICDNGSIAGLLITRTDEERIGGLRSDGNVLPIPSLNVRKISLPEGDVLVVEVFPSPMPPVRYKSLCYIRIGPRTSKTTEHDEQILTERRISHAVTFDARPCLEATTDDISRSLFTAYRSEAIAEEVIEENHRSYEEQLAALRFFDPHSGYPTNAAILLFGNNPRYFFPGAYIQYVRFNGTDIGDAQVVDQTEISGDMLSVLREVDIRISSNIETSMKTISAAREVLIKDYPTVALRELLLNAIVHRSYESCTPIYFYWFDDRVEIHNPGGLYPPVTTATFGKIPAYRNPVIAESLKVLGYINRFGYGVARARKEMEKNGNPTIEFSFPDNATTMAILHRRQG